MHRIAAAALLSVCFAGLLMPAFASAETVRREAAEHPRITKAIHEIEDAIRYMEAAPHDFGGHKAEAIRASREAVEQLRLALRYRAHQDTMKGK